MLLKEKASGDLIEILDIESLFSPTKNIVYGRSQVGQEAQGLTSFEKEKLIFPSGESLPRCWTDENYRN